MRALLTLCLLLVGLVVARAQTISQPPATLPVQSYSDDPVVLSTLLCSLNTGGGHGIGPLTPQSACMSMTLQPHSTSSVNAQTLPPSGIVTIFEPSSTAPSASASTTSSATSPPSAPTTTSAEASGSSTQAPRQTNAGQNSNSPPAVAVAIAKYNIGLLLFTGFALLAGVTYFLDELLGYLL